jgi:hypothetical protein
MHVHARAFTHSYIHIRAYHRANNHLGMLTVPIGGENNNGFISASVVRTNDLMHDTYAYNAMLAANAAFMNAVAAQNTSTAMGMPETYPSLNGPFTDGNISEPAFRDPSFISQPFSPNQTVIATPHDDPNGYSDAA